MTAILARELAHLPGQRHLAQFAIDARSPALGKAFDAGSRRTRAGAAAGLEGKHQMRGVRQALLEHRRQAVGGHHVETGTRRNHDAGMPGLIVQAMAMRKHVDLAGDIQIVDTLAQAGGQQGLAGARKRPRAVEQDAHAFEVAIDLVGIIQLEHASRQLERCGEFVEGIAVAPGEDRLVPAARRFGSNETAGIAVRPVYHQCLHQRPPRSRTFCISLRK